MTRHPDVAGARDHLDCAIHALDDAGVKTVAVLNARQRIQYALHALDERRYVVPERKHDGYWIVQDVLNAPPQQPLFIARVGTERMAHHIAALLNAADGAS